jgi:2-iminobutanoate/2-iminopropanoate deaminase
MSRDPVSTGQAPAPSGSYSQGIRAGGLLFCSGQGPFNSANERVGETIAEQVQQVLENLDAVARAAGATLQDAVRVGMFISDMAHFDEMEAAYGTFFGHPMPARTTVQSNLVGFDVEGDAVIFLPNG